MLYKNRYLILVVLSGLILMTLGYIFFKNAGLLSSSKIEVLDASSELKDDVKNDTTEIVVEISGEVQKPGVYRLPAGSRIDDLLIASGGLSQNADRGLVAKNINRAAKLSDGQKIYIPKVGQTQGISTSQTGGEGVTGLININTADTKTLDSLVGIGPVYAQNIIEHRPYSETSELVSKGAMPSNVYEKIKDKISCY
ncbi:MAG: helix-hairpin-helix domain-containing protein [Candidatus Woesebacteria bacterium]|nr:helix-hairpin-helix domain-containing protein [Candidatus Woesebacteria bacterium]